MAIDAKKYNLYVKLRGAEDTDYKLVGCATGQENLLNKGTRDLKGNNCRTIPAEGEPDTNGKRLKKKKFDNGSVTYTHNPTATGGVKILNDAFDDEENDVALTIKMELDDKGTGTAGTYVERDVLVTSIDVVENNDEEFEEKASLEFLNAPTKTDKVA